MKTKTKIIKALIEGDNPLTIKDLSKKIKADYRITHTSVKRLVEDMIVLPQKIGSSIVCQLNPKSCCDQIFKAEYERKLELLQDRNINQLYKDVSAKLNTSLYILLASKQSSNLNLIFVSNEVNFKEKVNSILSLIPLHAEATVLTEQQAQESNIKTKSHVILHGVDSYYSLIK